MKDYKVNNYARFDDSFTLSIAAATMTIYMSILAWYEIHKYFGF